jgi:uncharacterized protein (DUF1697 family)
VTTFIALLRGINLGKRQVSMTALRKVHETLGHRDVVTYIQSGNVVFDATGTSTALATTIEAALRERFGFDIPVVLRTTTQMAKAIDASPYATDATDATDPKFVHIAFLRDKPVGRIALDPADFAPDEFAVIGREVHFHLPNGMARSKLPGAVVKTLGGINTIRNLNTCRKLLELAQR